MRGAPDCRRTLIEAIEAFGADIHWHREVLGPVMHDSFSRYKRDEWHRYSEQNHPLGTGRVPASVLTPTRSRVSFLVLEGGREMSTQPGFRLAHTMIRVVDLDRTLDFYTRMLGMRVLRQNEYPGGRFTNTFVGYDEENASTVMRTHLETGIKASPTTLGTDGDISPSRFPTCTRPASCSRRKVCA